MKIAIIGTIATFLAIGGGASAVIVNANLEEQKWNRLCDGYEITETCKDENGTKYKKYLYHEAVEEVRGIVHHDAEPEQNHTIHHPAEPARTHTVYHEAQYGTRRVSDGCIRATVGSNRGVCAVSQCRDGEYSASSGRGTCSYHGGVARRGGPWYTYHDEPYIVKEAWTETVVDVPAKEAWDEVIVDKEAVPARDIEEVIIEARDAYLEMTPA